MFNIHNETEQSLLRVLAFGEGIISKVDFIRLTNKTMFSKYVAEGLLAQRPNAQKGIFQTTGKFKREYRRCVNPEHRFSGSGSVKHASGLMTAITTLPPDVQLDTGQMLKEELSRLCKTKAYINEVVSIQARELQSFNEAREQAEQREAMGGFGPTFSFNMAKSRCDVACSNKPCSAPDLRVTLTPEQLEAWAHSLNEHGTMEANSPTRFASYHKAGTQLLTLLAHNDGKPVQVCVEIVTGYYSPQDMTAKEFYAEVTDSNLITLFA